MNFFYWLGRLDAINAVAWIAFALLAIATIIFWIVKESTVTYGEHDSDYKYWHSFWARHKKPLFITIIVTALIGTFVPTKREALFIWGAGTVLEYVKDNKDLQTLPDKTVEIFSAWAENVLEDLQPEEEESE